MQQQIDKRLEYGILTKKLAEGLFESKAWRNFKLTKSQRLFRKTLIPLSLIPVLAISSWLSLSTDKNFDQYIVKISMIKSQLHEEAVVEYRHHNQAGWNSLNENILYSGHPKLYIQSRTNATVLFQFVRDNNEELASPQVVLLLANSKLELELIPQNNGLVKRVQVVSGEIILRSPPLTNNESLMVISRSGENFNYQHGILLSGSKHNIVFLKDLEAKNSNGYRLTLIEDLNQSYEEVIGDTDNYLLLSANPDFEQKKSSKIKDS